jgi:hypothetical protein
VSTAVESLEALPRWVKYSAAGLAAAGLLSLGGGLASAASTAHVATTAPAGTGMTQYVQSMDAKTTLYTPAQANAIYNNRVRLSTCMREKGYTTFPAAPGRTASNPNALASWQLSGESGTSSVTVQAEHVAMNECSTGNTPVPAT